MEDFWQYPSRSLLEELADSAGVEADAVRDWLRAEVERREAELLVSAAPEHGAPGS